MLGRGEQLRLRGSKLKAWRMNQRAEKQISLPVSRPLRGEWTPQKQEELSSER